MVDVLGKDVMYCIVCVSGCILMLFVILVLIMSGNVRKGDVFGIVCIVVI